MINLTTQEIVKEARKLHPGIVDIVADKVNSFLTSELNETELDPISLKKTVGDFLSVLLKSTDLKHED